jgi:hypothetical protein
MIIIIIIRISFLFFSFNLKIMHPQVTQGFFQFCGIENMAIFFLKTDQNKSNLHSFFSQKLPNFWM